MNGSGASTTASIRVPEGRTLGLAVALLLACAAAIPGTAHADLIVLTDGAVIKVASYQVTGDTVQLTLAEGGQLTMSIERVDRTIADEVVEREKTAGDVPEKPTDFTLSFSQGHALPDTPYADDIFAAAKDNDLNPSLLAAVAAEESRFDPRAVSRKGARGLLQVMPSTGIRLGVSPRDLFDPDTNLQVGARYLRQLIDRFGGDLALVLAAYNAGEGTVEHYGGVPPYRETLDYLQRIDAGRYKALIERLGLRR